jgi:rod shape-determining protein MreC
MSNKFSPKIIKFLAVSVICFLLIFFNPRGVFDPIRTVFSELTYPFQKAFYLVSRDISEFSSFISSIGTMREENEKLLRDNDMLAAAVAGLQEAKKENEALQEQLNLLPRNKFNLESSFVIGQDPQGMGNWIIIGKGSSNGIRSGMPVIVSDGILIGKVGNEVGWDSSKVDLLTNATSAVNAVDLETGAKGLVKGTYGLGIMMDMVSQSDILNNGDTIITSGLGGEVPRGLLIGKINEVKVSPDKLFQQAIVMPRVKYRKLDIVSIIKE